jgi:hypothetical protein
MTQNLNELSVFKSRKVSLPNYENADMSIGLKLSFGELSELNATFDFAAGFLDTHINNFTKNLRANPQQLPQVAKVPEKVSIEEIQPLVEVMSEDAFKHAVKMFAAESLSIDEVRAAIKDFGHEKTDDFKPEQRAAFIDKLACLVGAKSKN